MKQPSTSKSADLVNMIEPPPLQNIGYNKLIKPVKTVIKEGIKDEKNIYIYMRRKQMKLLEIKDLFTRI